MAQKIKEPGRFAWGRSPNQKSKLKNQIVQTPLLMIDNGRVKGYEILHQRNLTLTGVPALSAISSGQGWTV